MLTRRSFLAGAGAGLIAPRLMDLFQNYLAVHSEPLIIAPKYPVNTLLIHERRGQLAVRFAHMHRITWRQFLEVEDWPPYPRARYMESWGVSEDELDDDLSREAYWNRFTDHALTITAWKELQKLDLGPIRDRSGNGGGISFDGWHAGCWWAYCEDLLSVSLLQARLNELGTGLKVEWS